MNPEKQIAFGALQLLDRRVLTRSQVLDLLGITVGELCHVNLLRAEAWVAEQNRRNGMRR